MKWGHADYPNADILVVVADITATMFFIELHVKKGTLPVLNSLSEK